MKLSKERRLQATHTYVNVAAKNICDENLVSLILSKNDEFIW